MNYFEELNKFWRTGITNHLTPNASLLYLCLLDIANSRHWPNQFAVKSFVLEESTGIEKKDTVYAARNRLKQIGLIDFTSNKGSKIVNYKILGVDNAFRVLDSENEVTEKKPNKKASSKDNSSGEVAQKKGNLPDSSSELHPNLPDSSSDLDPDSLTDTGDSGIVKRNVKETQRNNDYILFVEWFNEHFGCNCKPATYKDKINTRLKTYSLDKLKQACLAMKASAYMMGENKSGKVYATLEYITRNDKQVDKWLADKIDPGGDDPFAFFDVDKFNATPLS